MDVYYKRNGLSFVWNAIKARTNREKHGVSFDTACEIFFDPLARVVDAGVEDESRDALIGVTDRGRLLFVVHIVREDDAIRLISAREAEPVERTEYEDYA